MQYDQKDQSFSTQEVLHILHNPDLTRVITEPPVKPRAGQVFLYHFAEESKRDDWRCDQYHFHHNGTRKQPKKNPKFNKLFFVIRLRTGKDDRFKKHAYILLNDDRNLVLFQYLGDESIAEDLPHGNAKNLSVLYTRICPSIIRSIKTMSICPTEALHQLEEQANSSAAPTVHKPRSLEHIWNIQFRAKQKEKTKKKKKKQRENPDIAIEEKKKSEMKNDDNNVSESLSGRTANDRGNVQGEVGTGVLDSIKTSISPNTQGTLLEFAKICESIALENSEDPIETAATVNIEDKANTSSINTPVDIEGIDAYDEIHVGTDFSENHPNANNSTTDRTHLNENVNQNADTIPCVTPPLGDTSSDVSHHYEDQLCPSETMQCNIQDQDVTSSSHKCTIRGEVLVVTEDMTTVPKPSETSSERHEEYQVPDSPSVCLDQNRPQVLQRQAVHATSMEDFLQLLHSNGILHTVTSSVLEIIEDLHLDSSASGSGSLNQDLCCYPAASVSATANSLIYQVRHFWETDFSNTTQNLTQLASMRNRTSSLQFPEFFHHLLAAVIVGSYRTRSNPAGFVQTLIARPRHLVLMKEDGCDVDPQKTYKIGSYSVSGRDIHRLDGQFWLDDSVIHSYLHLLQTRYLQEMKGKVFILECFLSNLWERNAFGECLFLKEDLSQYEWIMMPVCRNSHWVLLAANVPDRTVCVIDSRSSADVQSVLVRHWRTYMECRSEKTGEDLTRWQEIQLPIFPQTDGSSCGVFVLMAAEALLSGIPPAVMRNCHVPEYRRYVKRRLIAEMQEIVTAHTEDNQASVVAVQPNHVDSMDTEPVLVTSRPDKDTPKTLTPDLITDARVDAKLEKEPDGQETTRLGKAEVLMRDCRSESEDDNMEVELMDTKEEPLATVSSSCDQDPTDVDRQTNDVTMDCDEVNVTDIASSVSDCHHIHLPDSSGAEPGQAVCSGNEASDMVVDVKETSETSTTLDSSNNDESAEDLPSVITSLTDSESLCNALYTNNKAHFAALTLVCLENGKLEVSKIDNVSDKNSQLHNRFSWACSLSGLKNIEAEKLKSSLLHLTGTLLQKAGEFLNLHSMDIARYLSLLLTDNFKEYIHHIDRKFLHRHVKLVTKDQHYSHHNPLTLYLGRENQKALAERFAVEVVSHRFAFVLTHEACESYQFCKMLMRAIKAKLGEQTLDQLVKTTDEIYQGSFSHWLCFGKSAELYKLSTMFLSESHSEDIVVACCLSGNADILQLALEEIENETLNDLKAKSQNLPVIAKHEEIRVLETYRLPVVHLVSYYGHVTILSVLMKYKFDANKQLECEFNGQMHVPIGSTPASAAAAMGNIEVIQLLLEHGADCNLLNSNYESPLHIACRKGYGNLVKRLVSRCNVTERNMDGNTPLHLACEDGDASIVETLVNKTSEGDWSLLNYENDLPLDRACSKGHAAVVKLLLEKYGYPVPHDGSDTPLHKACKGGFVDVVKLLYQYRADRSVNADHKHPLLTAIKLNLSAIAKLMLTNKCAKYILHKYGYGHGEIVKLLLKKGADVSQCDDGYTPLERACKGGHVEIVKLLLEKGADVSQCDDDYTPLERACKGGHVEIVKLLLEKGADVSQCDGGYTPLERACKGGHVEIVKLLLEKGADVSQCDGGYTPLERASEGGHVEIVKLLLEKGADVSQYDDGYTPLGRACEGGHVEIVKLLLEKGADVSQCDEGYPPLERACEGGHVEIVKLLLEKGADVSQCDGGYKPLGRACEGGHVEIVKLLLEEGAHVSQYDDEGYTPLERACEGGHVEIVKLLLEKGAIVSQCDGGYTPLGRACEGGHAEIVKLLLEKGADVSQCDNDYTPLERACEGGHVEIVKLLLEKGADVSQCDGDYTPLERACEGGHVEIVKLLLEKGADVSQCDNDYTPLERACEGGHVEIVKLLLEEGADVSQCDDEGYTPLGGACEGGQVEIVKLLLEEGAHVSQCDGVYTPLRRACEGGHAEIVKLLLEKGADVSQCDGGYTPLGRACTRGHVEIIKLLLEKGADMSSLVSTISKILEFACDNDDFEAIQLILQKSQMLLRKHSEKIFQLTMKFCKSDKAHVVKCLLETAESLNVLSYTMNYQDTNGNTLLHTACANRSSAMLLLLLEKCSHQCIFTKNLKEETPVDLAVSARYNRIVRDLLSVNDAFLLPVPLLLKTAVSVGDAHAVRIILDKHSSDIDLNEDNIGDFLSELLNKRHFALYQILHSYLSRHTIRKSIKGDLYMPPLKELIKPIEAGSNMSIDLLTRALRMRNLMILNTILQNKALLGNVAIGTVALTVACELGDTEAAAKLLQLGVPVSWDDETGESLLHKTCTYRHCDIAQLIIDRGADVDVENSEKQTPLHVACMQGDASIVKSLLIAGAQVNKQTADKRTPFFIACQYGNIVIAQMLVEKGADMSLCDKNDSTPLHVCCKKDEPLIVRYLLENGAPLDNCDVTGQTPLVLACKHRSTDIVEALVFKGADSNKAKRNYPLHFLSRQGNTSAVQMLIKAGADVNIEDGKRRTPLILASKYGHGDTVHLIVQAGADLSVADSEKNTALHFLCRQGLTESAQILLDAGAEDTVVNYNGQTCLDIACQTNHLHLVDLLLKYGQSDRYKPKTRLKIIAAACRRGQDVLVAILLRSGWNPNKTDHRDDTPLHIALRYNQVHVLKTLLQYNTKIFTKSKNKEMIISLIGKCSSSFKILCKTFKNPSGHDSEGNTILHHACLYGFYDSVCVLCDRKAVVNIQNNFGQYPIHIAVENGNIQILRTLIKFKANIMVKDKDHQTPLHIACGEGNTETVKVLVELGAEINCEDSYLSTPLHSACRNGNTEVVKYLLDKRANIEHVDHQRNRCLFITCEKGNFKIMKILLERNALMNAPGRHGNTALHRACAQGHEAIVEHLLENGADPLVKNSNNNIPLYYAVMWGHVAIVKIILSKDPSFFKLESLGHKFLEPAILRRHTEIIHLLMDHGAAASLRTTDMHPLVQAVVGARSVDALTTFLHPNPDITDLNGNTVLHALCATEGVDVKKLKKVITCGVNVTTASKSGETPLHVCCKYGKRKLIHYLILKGGDTKAVDKDGCTLLHYACLHGHFSIAEELIPMGLNINMKNKYGHSPLDLAIQNNKYEVENVINLWYICTKTCSVINNHSLRHICQGNETQYLARFLRLRVKFERDEQRNTALHVACEEERPEIVQLLISAGLSPCDANIFGESPIHLACAENNILGVILNTIQDKQLSKKMISVQDNEGNTPLHIATYERQFHNVSHLLGRGADVVTINNHRQTALHLACLGGDENIVSLLVTVKADISAVDEYGDTPMHIACDQGHAEVLNLLLQNGGSTESVDGQKRSVLHIASGKDYLLTDMLAVIPDTESLQRALSVQDVNGNTALHVAAQTKKLENVCLLLAKGADVNIKNNLKQTALHIACAHGDEGMITNLATALAALSCKDVNGNTPLHILCQGGFLQAIKRIPVNCVDTESLNNLGRTLIHEGALHGHFPVVEYLIQQKCDVKAIDGKGDTVLHFGCFAGNAEIVKLFENTVVKPNKLGNTPLHVACGSGIKDIVIILLKNGYDVNKKNNYGETPLYFACNFGHTSIAMELLGAGAAVNVSNKDGFTPLQIVSMRGHLDTMNLLIAFKPELEAQTVLGKTALHIACKAGHLGTADALLKAGAKTDSTDRFLNTAFHFASSSGDNETVLLLAKWGASALTRNMSGDTPLHLACRRGNGSSVTSLLNLDCEILSENETGKTPLHDASENGHSHITQVLLKRLWLQSNILNPQIRTNKQRECYNACLDVACKGKHHYVVKQLLQYNADVNWRNKEGDTPLLSGCRADAPDIVKLLIGCGADIMSHDRNCFSPLHIACRRGNMGIVNLLIEKGANYTLTDRYGRSVLFEAVENGHLEITALLLKLGVDVSLPNIYKRTPLHDACWEGHTECVKLLITYKAILDAVNHYGNTALHNACMQGHEDIVQVLINSGAMISPTNVKNMTPLHYACLLGSEVMSDLLIKAGADVNVTDSQGRTPFDLYKDKDLIIMLPSHFVAGSKRRNETSSRGFPPTKRPRVQL